MAEFRVTFFNNLINSKGMPFKCLQRAVMVGGVKDADTASQKAKREFERLENVPNWKYRAQFLEVEVIAAKKQSPFLNQQFAVELQACFASPLKTVEVELKPKPELGRRTAQR